MSPQTPPEATETYADLDPLALASRQQALEILQQSERATLRRQVAQRRQAERVCRTPEALATRLAAIDQAAEADLAAIAQERNQPKYTGLEHDIAYVRLARRERTLLARITRTWTRSHQADDILATNPTDRGLQAKSATLRGIAQATESEDREELARIHQQLSHLREL